MTCIVGLVENGKVYIGADSAGTAEDYSFRIRGDVKVFHRGPFLMGGTSSFRMLQLLRFKLKIPKHPKNLDNCEYMVTRFVEAVRICFREGGLTKVENSVEEGGSFLVGYRGQLYFVHEDFQCGFVPDGYAACGCGEDFALGAMNILQEKLNPSRSNFGTEYGPKERVILALETAEKFSAAVRGPFVIESQE
jgi:ATP-dependent protease HslVU (ClpYQ) peptidase subunit